jgi:TolB-like protein
MASIVSTFEYDIFISYRHNDNLDGWVTDFVQNLEKELRSTLKDSLTIYFDKNPHDGLLETHNVDKSLEGKLKCLIFIPIISQTYCDTKSFAWQHEFVAFNKLVKEDQFGRDIKLSNGNVASRILPIKIHDLDAEDKTLPETEIGGALRAIEFIYKEAGVNRPLKATDDRSLNQNKTDYRNQVNKAANAIKEIISAIKNPNQTTPSRTGAQQPVTRNDQNQSQKKAIIISLAFLFIAAFGYFLYQQRSTNNLPTGQAGEQLSELDKSIAVLPFENMSGDSKLAFLAEGIPENLINRFSNTSGIRVFARSATFGLADSNRTIQRLNKLLKPDVVLTGQLQKKGDRYFLNCELVDAANQNLLWGNKYELGITDVSMIEDSIARSLSRPLKIIFAAPKNGHTNQNNKQINPLAYAEYLKGRYLSYGSTAEESEIALTHFREAIHLDPTYAVAYAALANEKITQAIFSTASKKEIVNEARTAIAAAKALNPELSDIYSAEGALKFYFEWDWQGAVSSYKKALELDPGNATIYIRYSSTLADVGRHKEALPLADKAVELDPISVSSLHNLGWVNFLAGNYEKSSEALGKALELHPNWVWGHIKKAYAHVFMKEFDKALVHAEKAELLLKDGEGSELLQAALVFIYKKCNQQEKMNAVIDRFLKYASKNTVKDPVTLSSIYYSKGDFNKAIEWEEKSVEVKSPSAYLLNIPHFYDKEYFESPGHQSVLKKMGFGTQK